MIATEQLYLTSANVTAPKDHFIISLQRFMVKACALNTIFSFVLFFIPEPAYLHKIIGKKLERSTKLL